MTGVSLATTPAVPTQISPIAVGLVASATLHIALLLGMVPYTPVAAGPRPLRVELWQADAGVHLAANVVSDSTVTPAASEPLAPAPASTPPTAGAAVQRKGRVPIELAFPADQYYTGRQLDVRAAQINDVQLVYPKSAYEMRMPGRVRLRLFINEHGTIDGVTVVQAVPRGIFERNAIAAARALVFSPGRKSGDAVKSQKLIEIVFNPYESINTP